MCYWVPSDFRHHQFSLVPGLRRCRSNTMAAPSNHDATDEQRPQTSLKDFPSHHGRPPDAAKTLAAPNNRWRNNSCWRRRGEEASGVKAKFWRYSEFYVVVAATGLSPHWRTPPHHCTGRAISLTCGPVTNIQIAPPDIWSTNLLRICDAYHHLSRSDKSDKEFP